jgi:hypothetical protein
MMMIKLDNVYNELYAYRLAPEYRLSQWQQVLSTYFERSAEYSLVPIQVFLSFSGKLENSTAV